MPGKVKVRIVAGRNLPVMDRSSDTTDAFVEVKLGSTTFKTEVFRKSLNPQWNSEWFKFEVDDEELQDEPLQIRIMDHDTYSAHDAIGKVYIDLNPLLAPHCGPAPTQQSESSSSGSGTGTMLSGWFPVFDTMHGVRGEIFVVVKVELFSDVNRFRQSSCGVRFFNTPSVPVGYNIVTICGFVEELVVNDDPEYQWIDKIRTQRSSNEARQTLFLKLSGEVRRRIGLKTLELGGNAVIGYKQYFDLEGESGIVVRGIGTVANLHINSGLQEQGAHGTPNTIEIERYGSPSNPKLMKLPVVKKKSSESDLSITPKGLSGSAELHTPHLVRQLTGSQHIYDLQHEMSEYPFLTLSTYPKHFISHIGGTVSARSVKLLDRITNPDEPETRDAWWAELRMEVRSHARALGCTFVLGYTEQTSICDEVCILSSSGTAAVVDFQYVGSFESRTRNSSGPSGPANLTTSFEREKNKKEQPSRYSFGAEVTEPLPCAPCHVPYNTTNIPCPVKLSRCNTCRKHKVPDVLLATIEIPKGIPVEGRGCLVQARVGRAKREYKSGGDSQAREVSDALPFLEYELHRQLLAKLRIRGMNAIFGLHVQVSIGEKHIIGLATGTAIYLSSLPPGRPPAISSTGNKEDQLKVAQMSKKLKDVLVDNRDYYGIKDSALKPPLHVLEDEDLKTSDQSEDSDDELPDIHLVGDNKDTCILEIDDPSELDIASVLTDDRPPKNFYSSTTELQPGMNWRNLESNYLSFTRVWQGRGPYPFTQKQLDDCFNILLQGLYFQLRKAAPCLISGLRFAVDLPDEETIQITICGMASRLQEDYPNQTVQEQAPVDSSMIFKLEDDPSHVNGEKKAQHRDSLQSTKQEAAVRDHPVVEITPLSQVPGTEIKKYLGNLNFFFVRESTSIRESGGLSAFVASFIGEVFAIARAHVAALGGNAMVAYTMSQYILVHNPHKNQGQCLINASGDAVFLSEASEK